MPSVGLEGELQVALAVADGRVSGVGIVSTRPDVAATLLQGATRAELLAAVPLLFAVCSRSQAAAAELACAAAAGEAPAAGVLAHHRAAVSAEMLREAAWRLLLEGPRAFGERPGPEAVAAARQAMAFDGSPEAADRIAVAALGMPAAPWLSDTDDEAVFHRWLAEGATAPARLLRRLRDETTGTPEISTPLLASPPEAAGLAAIGQALAADAAFARRPTWQGRPAETGALARRQGDGLVSALAASSRPLARSVARLREFAELLAGRVQARLGTQQGSDGSGLAWVENARGLLVHQVLLAEGRALRYGIVAPTEWNFHPRGPLFGELAGTPAGDRDELQRRAARLVHSLDPCVSCRIEVHDA